MRLTAIQRSIKHVVSCTLTLALVLAVAGVAQAQETPPQASPPVGAETARSALYSGRVLPVDASRIPQGATPQIFYPPLTGDHRTLAGAIAFETDRNGPFDLYEQPADGSGSATALVTGAGQQVTPAWSPDGRQLVYASDQDGDYEIYLREQAGQVRKLTNNTVNDVHPAWAPAGDRIYFSSDRAGAYFRIYSMRPDGNDVREMLAVGNTHVMAPSVSPNGAHIAYMRASVLEPLCQWNWDVWVMNSDGGNPHPVTSHLAADLYPKWTPDGSEVVLAGCRNFIDFDLYAVNVANGSQRRLNNWFLTNEWGAAYAADGAFLAFNSDRDQNIEVYTAPAAGGAASNLTRHPADDLAPSWRAQTGGSVDQISGRIRDSRGQGLSGVTVLDNLGHRIVTDTTGNFAFEYLSSGTYTITPSRASFTFSPESMQVIVPPGSTSLEFRGYDQPPLVFVHGWQGANPGALLFYDPNSTFQEIDDLLAETGYQTAFAYLQTSPLGTPPLRTNVPNLMEAIDSAKRLTGQSRVILVAHSMGGLVSRDYLESDLYLDDVRDLFTFGTPHHGMSADALLLLLGAASPNGLAAFCLHYQPAVCEFSEIGMIVFNLTHPNRANNVAYHLVSGNAPWSTLKGMGRVIALLTLEPDDGAVPTASGTGRWLTGIFNRWETTEAHGRSSGDHSYFYWNDVERGQSASYDQCLKPILIDERPNCRSTAPVLPEDDQSAPYSRTPMTYGQIMPNALASHVLTVEGGQTIFSSQWTTGALLMTLVSPTGVVVDPAYAASHPSVVTYETDDSWAAYTFPSAPVGQWQVRLQAVDVPPAGAAYATLAVFESTLRLSGGADQPWYRPGATAVLTASLSATTPSASVVAEVLQANGSSSTVNLAALGGGRYRGSYVVQNVPGYAEVRFLAQGTLANGGGFERSHSALFQISPSTASLNGSYTDMPVPRWPGAAVYAALDVTVGVNVTVAGDYSLSAHLVDGAGRPVAHALATATLLPGVRPMTLRFDGDEIYRSGRNGPYTLTNVLLVDNAGAALVIHQAQAVYVTRPYAARDFRVGDVFLPVVIRR
ncbi:MAG: carboxypeptidase regulatory-like domain-containing protein [Anaerolineae bacterium]